MSVSLIKLAQSGIGVVLSSIFGIGLIKLISIKNGPETLGYFGVFRQFFQLLTVVFTLGNGFAVIEGVPKAINKNEFIKQVSSYVLLVCTLLSIVTLVFSSPITEALFSNYDQINLIRSLPVMIFCVAYTLYIRSIFSAQGKLVRAGIYWSFSYMFMFIVGIVSTELLHIYLYGSILSFLMAVVFFKNKSLLLPSLPFKRLPSFERTALSTAIAGITGFFSFLIVRAICVNELGPQVGGYLESSWSLINYTVLVFLTSLSAYYLPQISARPEDLLFRKKFFVIINICSLGSLMTLCLGRNIFIPLLFSKEFLPASKLLIIMSVGEYFKSLNYFFSFSMIAISKKKAYLILDTACNFLFVLMAFLIPTTHLDTFGYMYVTYQFVYLIGSIVLNYRFKIIPNKFLGLNLSAGFFLWLVFLFSNSIF